MAPKKKTKKRGMESHDRIISKEKAPKFHKSKSSKTKTPSAPKTRPIVEIPFPRLKSLNLKNNPSFKSLNELFKVRGENSQYELTDAELDRTQWCIEHIMSCVLDQKKNLKEVLNSLNSVQSFNSQNPSNNHLLPIAVRPRTVEKVPLVKEIRQTKSTKRPLKNKKKTEKENKFWSFVKPYLAHVNSKDIRWLEELVLSYDSSENVYNIPPLGEHYSKALMSNVFKKQFNQSPCSEPDTKIMPNVVELVDKINHIAINDDSFQPVYQRVASALLEYSSMSVEDFDEQFLNDKKDEMSDTCKNMYFDAKKCGALGMPPVLPTKKDDDEVLDELNKCNKALAELQAVNKNQLTNLLQKCYIDYSQQKTREKIKKVDDEILNFKRKPNILLSNDEKIAQFSQENDEMALLTSQRSEYVSQLHSNTIEPDFSNFFSDDSESSDEEFNPIQEHFKMTQTKNASDVHRILETDDE